MRAIQIVELSGPDGALREVDIPEPEPSHLLTPASGVVVDVHAAGVSFPEVLQTRGEYQVKPDLPFVPGSEVGGVVRSAPGGRARRRGRPRGRVLRARRLRGDRGRARVPHLPAAQTGSTSRRAPALILNYHTAYFALKLARQAEARARPCSCTAPRAASAPPRSRSPRAWAPARSPSSRATRRRSWRARRAPTRWCAPTARGRTRQGALGGGVDVVLDPVGGDRFTD